MAQATKGRPPLKKFKLFRRVAILDEHHLPATGKEPEVNVGPEQLARIAKNGNDRIARTNDWTPLVIGHTKDGGPELPVEGYAGNFTVGEFVNDEGRRVKALYCDQYIDDEDGQADRLARRYPRRSVELWTSRMQVDPICMLGATSPERDLGLLVRYARDPLTGRKDRIVRLASPRGGRPVANEYEDEEVRRYKAKAPPKPKAPPKEDDELPDDDGPDVPPGEEPEDNPADSIPDMGKKVGELTVGELFSLWSQTAPMKFVEELMQHADGLGGGDTGDEFGPPGAGGGPPPGAGMGPPGAGMPPEGHEARAFHEPPPVHYEAGGSMGSPGAGNTYVPGGGAPHADPLHSYGGYAPPPPPPERHTHIHHAHHYERDFENELGPEEFPEEEPVTPTRKPRASTAEEVLKLSRENVDMRKKLASLEKKFEAQQEELEANRAERRKMLRSDDLRQYAREEQIAIEDEAIAEDIERFAVADMDEEKFSDFKDWMKRRYGRRLPNNGQRVDFARQAPRSGAPKGTDPTRDEGELDKIIEFATRKNIKDFDEAKAQYRASRAGAAGS